MAWTSVAASSARRRAEKAPGDCVPVSHPERVKARGYAASHWEECPALSELYARPAMGALR